MAGILLCAQLPTLLSFIFRVQRSAYCDFTVCWTGIQDRDHRKWYLHQLTRHEHTWQKSPLLCGDGRQQPRNDCPVQTHHGLTQSGYKLCLSCVSLLTARAFLGGHSSRRYLYSWWIGMPGQLCQGLAMPASSPHRELHDELHPNLAYRRLCQRTKTKQGFQRQTSR